MDISQKLPGSEGSIAFEVAGSGPLVVCVPGMGDLRSTYRFNSDALRSAGFRVALVDLRGHGESDTTFAAYGDEPTAADLIGLIEHLGGPAIIVGNSMAAGSAVLVASRRPDLVVGLGLIGPFVRAPKVSPAARLVMRVMMMPALAALSWNGYLPKLYAGTKPTDFADHRASMIAAIRSPGHAKAFSLTTRTSHTAAGEALPAVSKPAAIIMGERDPDFPDPAAEAEAIRQALAGEAEVTMIPEAGHYPHSQRPELVNATLIDFCRRVTHA